MRWRVAFALALATAGCGSHYTKTGGRIGPHTTVLRVASPQSPFPGPLAVYADQVARASGGTLAIRWVSADHWGAAGERATIADVRAGRFPLGVAGARAWDTPQLRALVAPFAITSYAHQDRVLRSPAAREMLASVRDTGVTGLALLPGPLRRMLGIARRFRTATDFRGARVGIQASSVAAATMRALGAVPVALAPGPNFTGVAGYEQHLGAIAGNDESRRARSVTTDLVFWPRPLVVFANPRALARLTPAQRRALALAAQRSIAPMTVADEAEDRAAAAQLCHAGFRLDMATPAELGTFGPAVQPVYRSLERDAAARRLIGAIRALAAPGDRPLVPTCPPPAGRPPARPTELDGVYTRSISAAQEMRADQVSQPISENYGAMVLVIAHGRFAQTQINRMTCSWGYGTSVLHGGRLDQIFIDGGGHGLTGAQNKPGEHFIFKPTLFHDTLELNAISPSDLPSQTWHRTRAAPTLNALEPHCRPPANALG